jgi:hypothetical protein
MVLVEDGCRSNHELRCLLRLFIGRVVNAFTVQPIKRLSDVHLRGINSKSYWHITPQLRLGSTEAAPIPVQDSIWTSFLGKEQYTWLREIVRVYNIVARWLVYLIAFTQSHRTVHLYGKETPYRSLTREPTTHACVRLSGPAKTSLFQTYRRGSKPYT